MSKRSREASFSPPAGRDCPLVSDTNIEASSSDELELEAERPKKVSHLELESLHSASHSVMQCSLPPHRQPLDFANIEAFEVHYSKEHCNRCSSCGKNFPSPHFLALHIDENHNAMRAELQAKGEKTYGCFVEGCDRKCSTPEKRRLHLIDKHTFPRFYNFRVVDQGIDAAQSMLREPKSHRRRVSTTTSPADAAMRRRRASSQLVNGENHETIASTAHATDARSTTHRGISSVQRNEIDKLEQSMSALQFVPPSVMRQQANKP